jgi:hypothetical protein
MERIEPTLAELPLLDADASPRPLRTLWERQTAVLIFVRHFG